MNLPETRRDLLVQDLRDEVLIYDKSTNKSYCLNSTARTVFNACDGAQTFADTGLPEDVVYFALDELQRENLLASRYVSPYAGMNRREVIRKIGFASMIALPVITSLVAPPAARAASGSFANGAACSDNSSCRSQNCITTRAFFGGTVSAPGRRSCCVPNGGNRTGRYASPGLNRSGFCEFAESCCTGTGSEIGPDNNGNYSCACAVSS